MVQYRFYLQRNDGERLPVNPIHSDSLSIDYEKENGQRFFRRKLKGRLTFVRNDYKLIMDAPFDTIYKVHIDKGDGHTFSPYFVGQFMRTDCTINEHDRVITTSVETLDQYNDILAGWENEYNLISLAPEIKQVSLQKRPCLQIYIPGSDVLTNIYDGITFEQEVTSTNLTTEITGYYFGLSSVMIYATITGSTLAQANGRYYGKLRNEGAELQGIFTNQYGYKLDIRYSLQFGFIRIFVRDANNTELSMGYVEFGNEEPYDLEVQTTGQVAKAVKMTILNVWARYLLDEPSILGVQCNPIPADDIVENNRNYHYTIKYETDIMRISVATQEEPTEWGLAYDGEYFIKPYPAFGHSVLPIARSSWRDASYWVELSVYTDKMEAEGRTPRTLRDTYPIHSVIQVLLARIAPNISHYAESDYSEILYGNSNPITSQFFRLLITPITNITRGDYTRPAQKANITLKEVFDMLANALKCYWYIDEGNRLCIEHIKFFENGGTYAPNIQEVEYDLTTLQNFKNGKKWAFDTSSYTFDKINMPARYEYGWANDTTKQFKGSAIDIRSNYVQKDKVEEINIGGFTSDVDMMMIAPGTMSEDGFALLGAIPGELLTNPDTTLSPGVHGVAGDTLPRYKIIANNRYAVIKLEALFEAGTSLGFVFQAHLANGGVRRITGGNWTIPGAKEFGFDVPADAVALSFKITSGEMTLKILSVTSEDFLQLPFVETQFEGGVYNLQNGFLAMANLIPNWLLYDMPTESVEMNGATYNAQSVAKNKKQTISFPVGDDDPDTLKLVQTYLGEGEYESLSINLYTRTSKTTLKYDTK